MEVGILLIASRRARRAVIVELDCLLVSLLAMTGPKNALGSAPFTSWLAGAVKRGPSSLVHYRTSGRYTSKVVPRPGSLVTRMRPPWASTIILL